MSNKTLIVAGREYTENLRTKAFWIGILFFPIILIGSIAVPRLLDRAKEARYYAVVDESGFLLKAVEERAQLPDLEKVFTTALSWRDKGGAKWERQPQILKDTVERIVAMKDTPVMKMLDQLPPEIRGDENDKPEVRAARFYAWAITALNSNEGSAIRDAMPSEAKDRLNELRDGIRDWWKSLPPEEAKEFDRDLAKARYVRVDAPTGGDVIAELNQRVGDKKLFAYFVIGKDPVHSDEGSKYVSNNLTDNDLRRWFAGLATEEIRDRRLAEKEIAKDVARWIQKPLSFVEKQLGKGGKEEEVEDKDKALKFAPLVFVYLLWMAVFTISQMLLTNTIEEKSNRILEVLLSSVTPLQLMLGKILGIAATGLTVTLSWIICFVLAVKVMPMMGFEPPFDLTPIITNPAYLVAFIGYFLAGYLFFAALFVGIGSVCNSLKEAQNLVMPVTMVLMVPLFAMMPVVQDPDGRLAKFLSWVPPFTPFVMMNRAGGTISQFEYIGTGALLLVSILVAMWASAKVFRIGVLMTGKAPTPGEILRWIKAPVGQVPVHKDGEHH